MLHSRSWFISREIKAHKLRLAKKLGVSEELAWEIMGQRESIRRMQRVIYDSLEQRFMRRFKMKGAIPEPEDKEMDYDAH